MAIRVMVPADYPGAVLDEYWTKSAGHEIYLRTFAVGCVVEDRERNFRDDSDFYAIYYDEESGTFKEYEYGTTRAWTYPNRAWVDATPEIEEKYKEFRRRQARHQRALEIVSLRARDRTARKEANLTVREWQKLRDAVGYTILQERYIPLLRSDANNRLRSGFRKSLAFQVRKWLRGESDFRRPLSPRQEDYL